MTKVHEQEIRRFKAVSDKGDEYTVIEYQRITEFIRLNDRSRIAKDNTILRLDDGALVTDIDANTFEILQTEQIIRKVG